MKLRSFTLVLMAVSLLAIGSLAAACGGDDDDDGDGNGGSGTPLESYFAELISLRQTFEAQGEAMEADLEGGLADTESAEDAIEVFDDFIEDATEAAEDFRDNLDELEAPSEVESLHNELTALFDVALSALEGLASDIANLETPDDIVSVGSDVEAEFTALSTQTEAVCFQLQGVADDNAVDVELDCGSDE